MPRVRPNRSGEVKPKLKKPQPVRRAISRLIQPIGQTADISGDVAFQELPEPVAGPSQPAPAPVNILQFKFATPEEPFSQPRAAKRKTRERAEQLQNEELPSDILNTRRPATKVRFSPKMKTASERKTREEFDLDHPGLKESVEVCQGISKIKLEEWFPFFDFKYNAKRGNPEPEVVTETAEPTTEGAEANGEDNYEWEESLVYVDLEDIPHAEGIFASLAPPNGGNESGAALSHVEMKIFNMDSQLPVLLLGGKHLAGQWQDTLGTSLFFQKKSESSSSSPSPQTSTSQSPSSSSSKTKLKNIVPEPEIPFDPLFGDNYTCKEDGYELVAKSFKVLKAKHFPVVNEDQKREDFIRDNDDEFDPRDFQIPPISMIRQFTTEKDLNYEKYVEDDIKRRREIHEKWGSKRNDHNINDTMIPTIKTEPTDIEHVEEDAFLTRHGHDNSSEEPVPGPSHAIT